MSAAEPEDVWESASPEGLIDWGPTTSVHLPSASSGSTDFAIPDYLWGSREIDGATRTPQAEPAPVLRFPTAVPPPPDVETPSAEHMRFVPATTTVSGSSGQLDAAALDALLEPTQAPPTPTPRRSGHRLRRLLHRRPR
ncbi:MAG: hypothetical protein AVDCRST_MAG10-3684 [uncultured Acidimicrobiales bacterium]|uniref:Uncharacterized protein n=1 Tax=uncultured Acidimicrobiales bacterium TaxID=310071 RepID=A0A6J4JFG5_9ACTN|nr:MAG: hypothetical protein AVDCRST_MAG10-3684 [uncultured Acidimicrobiales bacterium]